MNLYPALADRALPAARRYAQIAPAVPHALHMPSHVFIRLGLREEAIQSNLAGSAAAEAYAAGKFPGATWDQQLHGMDYLEYAYLQNGQLRRAGAVVDALGRVEKTSPEASGSAAYALTAIPARFALEQRRWADAAALELRPASYSWKRFPWTEANVHFARAIGAARSGDTPRAEAAVARLEALRDATKDAKQAYWTGQVEIQRQAAAAWLALAAGKHDEAVALMRSAADVEDATEKLPVTPGSIVPARELLGSMLLELGRPDEAGREFERVLRDSPNRFNALYGAARAAELSGDRQRARSFYEKVVTLSSQADTERPELAEAKAVLARQ